MRPLLIISSALATIFVCGAGPCACADEASRSEPPITEADREHWAFRPLSQPALPDVDDAVWCVNPIDRFVLARLEAAGLAPSAPADRVTLIRRVSFDLTGLPPSPE